MQTPDTKEILRSRLLRLGFDVVRFARIGQDSPGAKALDAWLEAGMHAGMDWLGRNGDKRKDPRLVLDGACTLIALGANYATRVQAGAGGGGAVFARYAQYDDYHDTLKPGLQAAGRELETVLGLGPDDYRYYVDTGPVLERSWAERSGMGFVGKNAMLISRDFGNWLFLAVILVRAKLDPDPELGAKEEPTSSSCGDRRRGPGLLCGKCTRCIELCPTRAIVAPGVVDARRCISYLTIENKGAIPEELRSMIGGRVYGCDVCAEVCPWNRFAKESRSLLLKPRPEIAALKLRELLRLDATSFAEVFRRTPIKRIKLAGLLRNACVAAGNSGDLSLIPALQALERHDSPLVREHAAWALRRLTS